MWDKIPYSLFGLREMLKRERGTRERGKRCPISTIWSSREIAERGQNYVGPTSVLLLS
jgi:hypothetical protein